jgi:hypothetical protein
MFFWVGVAVVLLVVGAALGWALRGYDERAHRPGTQRLRTPSSGAATDAASRSLRRR